MDARAVGLIALWACVGVTPPDSPSDSSVDSPTDSDPPPLPGQALYFDECLGCHGPKGDGSDQAPALHAAMAWDDDALIDVMVAGQGDMDARSVTREEGQHIVDWMRANF